VNSFKLRVAAFTILGVLLATANTYGSTLAASLFLSRAGADAIPAYYILYAVVSIPASVVFARLIDRWPRPQFFSGILVVGAVLALGAAALAAQSGAGAQGLAVLFALYAAISVFEQLSYSVYYVVLGDYFTSTETNRSATTIAVGLAGGGLLGGGLAGVGSLAAGPAALLYGMPALLALTLGAFLFARGRLTPIGEAEPQAEDSLWESLKSIRPLVARFPIVGLLALGVFLNIAVQSVTEYQVFVVYTEAFPDEQQLTSFLGWMNGALNVINIATSYALTQPLMNRLGVARMNLVYPLMTVAAFAGLGLSFALPAAIFAHVVYDPWAHSVDAPVFVANYNAVPRRFVSRVRVFCDGIVYPLAMALTGGVLVLIQALVPQGAITLGGLVLALAFLACGAAIRTAYAAGLLEQIRAGTIDLDHAGADAAGLLAGHAEEIRSLLASDDHNRQMLGLELAVRGDARPFLHEIEDLLGRAVAPVRRTFVTRFAQNLTPAVAREIENLLASDEATVRALALEALTAAGHTPPSDTLARLLADASAEVRAIAVIAAERGRGDLPGLAAARASLLAAPTKLKRRAAAVIGKTRDSSLADTLIALAADQASGDAAFHIDILDAAAALAAAESIPPQARRTFQAWAATAAADGDPAVRRAAMTLLGALAEPDAEAPLKAALQDVARDVRAAAAEALARRGAVALPVFAEALDNGDPAVEDTAIAAIGRIGGEDADGVLFRHMLGRHFSAVRRNLKWLQLLPETPPWRPLEAVLIDENAKTLDAALHTLAALGYRQTLNAVRGILAAGDVRTRANAIEAVASLSHRRFIQPLLPLLEFGPAGEAKHRHLGDAIDLDAIVQSALHDRDRWLRAAALIAAKCTGRTALMGGRGPDPDALVRRIRDELSFSDVLEAPTMSRLLFLKTVPLFEGLSLDDVLSVDAALGQADYLAGETIVAEGEAGSSLYILHRGTASVRIGQGAAMKEIARLGPGDFFGEMTLFDDLPRSATVAALTDCSLLSLDRDRFSTLIGQRPVVLLQICKMFGSRLRETNRKLLAS
jgi:HEAT repeat protein/MFS family permease